ncbi:MAG: response regulator [Archangiaceae bacterium]|nr:response regulator [Archangiaceae bacterium]
MTRRTGSEREREALRRKAEARFAERGEAPVDAGASAETQRLLHELQVHQLELELQNEELEASRVQAEQHAARYAALYEFAPVGYLSIDREARVLRANQCATQQLGLELQGAGPALFVTLLDPSCHQRFRAFVTGCFASPAHAACEVRTAASRGSAPRALELTGVRADDGSECRVVMLDVTERKQAEAALVQAERLATLGLVAANVSHELNNPLTYLRAAVEQLVHDAASPQLLACAEEALDGVRRIEAVTRGLDTFSRDDQGPLVPTEVNATLEAAMAIAAHELQATATVERDLGEVPRVLANEARLGQLLLNLLVNASRSFTPHEASRNRLTVRTWAEGEAVLVEIGDNGPGLPPQVLARLFDPLATHQVGSSSSLGLAICKRLVGSLGGDLTATSAPGAGTRFRVRLQQAVAVAAAPAPRVEVALGGKPRVLVIDDEPRLTGLLKRLLTPAYQVTTVEAARDAQRLLAGDAAFDVIFCDLMMPVMSGMQLHTWLVAEHPGLAARVIFMTGGVFSPAVSAYLEQTPHRLVLKPFDVDTVLAEAAEVAALKKG